MVVNVGRFYINTADMLYSTREKTKEGEDCIAICLRDGSQVHVVTGLDEFEAELEKAAFAANVLHHEGKANPDLAALVSCVQTGAMTIADAKERMASGAGFKYPLKTF